MAVRPDVAALVAAMASAGPPFEELGAVAARRASTARRLAAAVEPPAVAGVEDATVPGPGRDVPVRIYRADLEHPAPVVVFVHGGGWVLCDLDSHDVLCRRLVRASGCTLVSVGYRLAPEHPFPAGLDDVELVTDWVRDHLGDLGTGEAVGLVGDSAGANLALVAALARRGVERAPVGALGLLYPVVDSTLDTASYREHATGFPLTAAAMRWYWDQYVPDPADRTDPRVAPQRTRDLAGTAPTFVATAGLDPLRDEGEALVARLAGAGVPVGHQRFAEVFHGFASIAALPESAEVVELVADHLRRHLAQPVDRPAGQVDPAHLFHDRRIET